MVFWQMSLEPVLVHPIGTCYVAASPLQEARQPGLVQEAAGVVAGRAVHAEAHVDTVIQCGPYLRGAR